MTTYNIVTEGNQIWVTWKSGMGLPYRNGPYRNEKSAKRRVRDLKRKDSAEYIAIAVPVITTAPQGIVSQAMAAYDAQLLKQRTGVYPARSKHSYRR